MLSSLAQAGRLTADVVAYADTKDSRELFAGHPGMRGATGDVCASAAIKFFGRLSPRDGRPG